MFSCHVQALIIDTARERYEHTEREGVTVLKELVTAGGRQGRSPDIDMHKKLQATPYQASHLLFVTVWYLMAYLLSSPAGKLV